MGLGTRSLEPPAWAGILCPPLTCHMTLVSYLISLGLSLLSNRWGTYLMDSRPSPLPFSEHLL